MTKDIVTSTDGAAFRIELNRAECGNLVTMEMVEALSAALRSVPKDAKLVVFAGRGADFCRGRDYQAAPESAQQGRTPSAQHIIEHMTTPIVDVYSLIREVAVPTVSIVQGAAYGFGCALACACDIVLAGEGGRFRLPEMKRGLPPTLAMFALMEKVSPRALAYLVYSTAEFDARAALDAGLASAVFPDGELEAQAAAFATTLGGHPLDAVKAVKEYLKRAPLMEPRGRADFGASLFAGVLSSR